MIRALKEWVKRRRQDKARRAERKATLDLYVDTAPSDQNALDIFRGEWGSRFPSARPDLRSGDIPLFEDSRVEWGLRELGGVEGQSVLELGPMEGGHSWMLEQRGAARVIAVEANTRSYLKCLVVKEVLGVTRVRFLCGDFMEYLREGPGRFDLVFASGVLYHMQAPAELIALLARTTDRVFIWTHYFDERLVAANPVISEWFGGTERAEHRGFAYTLHRYQYQHALEFRGFRGAGNAYSNWITRADLMACLQHFGFDRISVNFEEPNHHAGPCLSLVATRSSAPTPPSPPSP